MRWICLPHTELPGTSALFADYLYNYEKVAAFYEHNPHDPRSIVQASREVRLPDERRSALVEALRATNATSASLDLLDLPGTVAVVTGQQVGLFSGPAYTIYKALTAARLARQLSANGIRAVPVFWLATEDHDLEEADHVTVFGPAHRPVRLQAGSPGGAPRPVGSIEIPRPPVEELREVLAGFLHAGEVLDAVAQAYQPGRTYGEAFRLLLQRLLSGYGLIFIDPMDAGVRRISAPFLQRALEHAPSLYPALRMCGRKLVESGYHAQVLVEEQSSLFFYLENGHRLSLRVRDGAYFHETRRFEPDQLRAQPERLSPNALLRPVLQDWLLPTVAYVGGPAELAYLAQSQILYEMLLDRAPVAVPRSGFTLLDERAYSLLERYHITVPDVLHGEDALRERIAARLIPASLQAGFSEAAAATSERLRTLENELAAFDPTLGAALAKSRAKILYQIEKNRGKAAREALRRGEQVGAGVAHLSGLLYPGRHLQERTYSILPFLAKHGVDLIDTLYENTCRACPDHLLLTV